MTQNVDITMTSTDKGVLKLLEQQTKALEKLESRMDRTGEKGKQSGEKTKKAFGDAEKNALNLAVAITGVSGVINGIQKAASILKSEYDALIARQESSRASAVIAADAIRAMRINFAGDDTLKNAQLEEVVTRLAGETGSTSQIVAGSLSSAFSAKGNLSNQAAVDAVRQALRLLPRDQESAVELAGRILDVQKIAPELDAKAVAGFLRNAQQSARVTRLDQFGKAAIPTVTGMFQLGDSPEQAAELVATATQFTADVEGLKSARGVRNLASALSGFQSGPLSTRGKDQLGSFKIPQEQIDLFRKATNTQERIAAMQQSPELRRQFLGQTSFDSFIREFSKAIVSGEPVVMGLLKQTQDSIVTPSAESAKVFDQFVDELNAGRFEQAAAGQRESEAAIEAGRLADNPGQRAAATRNILKKTFEEIDLAGIDAVERKILLGGFEFDQAAGLSPEQAGIRRLKQAEGQLRQGFFGPRSVESLSEGDRISVNLLRETVEVLRRMEAKQGNVASEPKAASLTRGN